MPVRKKLCETQADELLRGAAIAAPPVDTEGLAASLLLKVVRIPDWRHHARALLEHGEIRVNAKNPPYAQRFSIGHEIGHYLLHPHGFVFSSHEDPESDLYATDPERALEDEAEYFAGALLMPRRWLRRDVDGRTKADDLMRRYEVSREALFVALSQYRLVNRLSG